ncbi:D-alanyl-D-alanine carboxypeptidase [uncultured Paracoccus sp.]|uniref:D-alanyl-D-alanine carboxypeptidase n=1 Tax=uncultured Paracoccus sp. TaxID=189685 RepID=UPI00260EE725|nr:D-alanyl-D-alanine carboxypeptidase [uncultured Paracoccus sp.]
MDRRAVLAGLAGVVGWGVLNPGPAVALDGSEPLAPRSSTRPRGRPPADAQQLVDAARLGGQVAFAALASDGTLLDARAAETALPAASTLKTVTALYALHRLGAGQRFATRVRLDGETLILEGGGDPVMDSDALAVLAADTAAAVGARPVTRFEVWGGALPRMEQIAPGQAVHLPYNPALSGMMLNFNRVHLDWRGGRGDLRLALTARGSKVAPPAYTARVRPDDRSTPLFAYDGEGPVEQWTLARRGIGPSGTRWLPVRRPELYAGDVFQTLCRAKGLALPTPEVADLPPKGEEVARYESPRLQQILRGMLVYSTNLTAEAVGLAASGAGDLRASGAAMADWLRAQHVSGSYAFADHSGLSPDSRISAASLTRMLAGPGRAAGLADLLRADPLADMLGAQSGGRTIRAKTGTLNFVSNLAGYGPDGISFAILTADAARRAATHGAEQPQGVIAWTIRSKRLQRDLVDRFWRLSSRDAAGKSGNATERQSLTGSY